MQHEKVAMRTKSLPKSARTPSRPSVRENGRGALHAGREQELASHLAVLEDVLLGDEAHVVRRACEGGVFSVGASHSAATGSSSGGGDGSNVVSNVNTVPLLYSGNDDSSVLARTHGLQLDLEA